MTAMPSVPEMLPTVPIFRRHPGLVPGSRATVTPGLQKDWTPEQVRGDSFSNDSHEMYDA